MSSAFMSGVTIKVSNNASPEVYTTIGEAISLSGLGKTNALVDVTNFDSNGSREYISGLADGTEIGLQCNFLPADTVQSTLTGFVDSKTNTNLQITITDGTTPKIYTFTVTPLSWTIEPAVDDKNTITYSLKISGGITVT